jgi:hypothetical protein
MAGYEFQRAIADLGSGGRSESAQIGEIYQLQANYHRAKTTQDITERWRRC